MTDRDTTQSRPRTLIVSWHWPPTNRASAGVLGTLFASAPPGVFRVITRSFPNREITDHRNAASDFEDRIPITAVPWPHDDQSQPTLRTWPTVVRAIWNVVRAALRIHRTWQAERVLAVFPHRLSLLAGWLLARITGLPLVLYMHDLCAESMMFRNPLRRLWWTWVDRVCLKRAWMIIVPTEEFAAHYRSRGFARCWVLPHCVPPERLDQAAPRTSDGLRLTYSGALYEPHAGAAEAFLAAAETAPNVDLTLLTNPNACGGLPAAHGARWLPHARAMKELARADVFVVLLGRRTPCPREVQGCFPSKIVDCLQFGRPILAIVPRGSFVDRLVTRSGCGIAVHDHDPSTIIAAIERLRDERLRDEMAVAARRLARQLRADDWMPRLIERLEHSIPQPYCPPAADAWILEQSSCPL